MMLHAYNLTRIELFKIILLKLYHIYFITVHIVTCQTYKKSNLQINNAVEIKKNRKNFKHTAALLTNIYFDYVWKYIDYMFESYIHLNLKFSVVCKMT